MTAEYIKQSLLNSIQFLTDYKRDYSRHPETDYTRNRKIPFDKAIAAVLSSPITYFISMQRMIYFNIYIWMPFFKNSEIRMNAVH